MCTTVLEGVLHHLRASHGTKATKVSGQNLGLSLEVGGEEEEEVVDIIPRCVLSIGSIRVSFRLTLRRILGGVE